MPRCKLSLNPLRSLRTLRLIKTRTAEDAKSAEGKGGGGGSVNMKTVTESFAVSAGLAVKLKIMRLSCFSNENSAYYTPYDGTAVAEMQLSAFLSKNINCKRNCPKKGIFYAACW